MAVRRTSARTAAWTRPRPRERLEVKPKAAKSSASAAEQVQRRLREQVRKRRSFCCSVLIGWSHVIEPFNPRLFLYFSAANGATEAQGIVGRTPPQSAARTKSRQAKAPTQAGEFVRTHCIPLWFHLYGLGWLRLTAFLPALQLALRKWATRVLNGLSTKAVGFSHALFVTCNVLRLASRCILSVCCGHQTGSKIADTLSLQTCCFVCRPIGRPNWPLGSESVSHRCPDGYFDWRAGSKNAVLQRSHVEALYRSVCFGS